MIRSENATTNGSSSNTVSFRESLVERGGPSSTETKNKVQSMRAGRCKLCTLVLALQTGFIGIPSAERSKRSLLKELCVFVKLERLKRRKLDGMQAPLVRTHQAEALLSNLVGSDVDVLRQPVLFGAKLAPTVAVVQLLDELRQNLSKSRWQHENCV